MQKALRVKSLQGECDSLEVSPDPRSMVRLARLSQPVPGTCAGQHRLQRPALPRIEHEVEALGVRASLAQVRDVVQRSRITCQ